MKKALEYIGNVIIILLTLAIFLVGIGGVVWVFWGDLQSSLAMLGLITISLVLAFIVNHINKKEAEKNGTP